MASAFAEWTFDPPDFCTPHEQILTCFWSFLCLPCASHDLRCAPCFNRPPESSPSHSTDPNHLCTSDCESEASLCFARTCVSLGLIYTILLCPCAVLEASLTIGSYFTGPYSSYEYSILCPCLRFSQQYRLLKRNNQNTTWCCYGVCY